MTEQNEAKAPPTPPVTMPPLDPQLVEKGMRFLSGSLTGPPSDEQLAIHRSLVEDFATLYAEIHQFTAAGRHRSLAITALEQAKMYAIAALYDGDYSTEA